MSLSAAEERNNEEMFAQLHEACDEMDWILADDIIQRARDHDMNILRLEWSRIRIKFISVS